MKPILASLVFLFSLLSLSADTVTGLVQVVGMKWSSGTKVVFTPTNTLRNIGGTAVRSQPAEAIVKTNGSFSTSLIGPMGYRVAVGDTATYPSDVMNIFVPGDSGTYDWLSLTTNSSMLSSNNAKFIGAIKTNGTTVGSQLSLNFVGSVLATNDPANGKIDVAIIGGGGSGDVTTSQLNTASNALVSLMAQMDTTTSNGLYSLIVGGGITAGTATNIAQFFATNSAIVTSNTLYSLISTNPVVFHPGSLLVTNTMQIGSDVVGERVSSGVLGLRNGNTPQGLNLYRYSTNSNADTEYGFLQWFSTEFQLGLNKAGVGQNRSLGLAISGSTRWRLGTDSSFAPTAVYKLGSSSLPIGDITSIGVVNASNVVVAGGSPTRVGIGTTNPAVELDIYGAVRLENLTASRLLGINAQKDLTNLTLDASLTLAGDTLSVTVATNPVVFGPGLVVVTNGYAIGGTSSSHVYLRRNGTQMLVRLGDDSAYAPAMASYWSTHNGGGEKSSLGAGGTGNLWTGSDGRLIWSSASSLSSGTGTADTGIYRHGAGTNAFGTSTISPAGSILASNLWLVGRAKFAAGTASALTMLDADGILTNVTIGAGLQLLGTELSTTGGGGGGEANTASSLGSGWPWTAGKSGVDLRFNTFTNGSGLTTSSNNNALSVAVDWAQVASQTNLTAASNALRTSFIANDTTTSNGVISEIITASNNLRTTFVANDTTTSNGAVAFTMAASNTAYNFSAGKQTGSMLLSNLLAMGISNIVAGTNMLVQTNAGTLVLNNSAPAASGTNLLVQTNGVNVGSVGTVNWTTGVTGSISGTVATLGVSASGGGSGLTTNANQFAPNETLTIKSNALVTNLVNYLPPPYFDISNSFLRFRLYTNDLMAFSDGQAVTNIPLRNGGTLTNAAANQVLKTGVFPSGAPGLLFNSSGFLNTDTNVLGAGFDRSFTMFLVLHYTNTTASGYVIGMPGGTTMYGQYQGNVASGASMGNIIKFNNLAAGYTDFVSPYWSPAQGAVSNETFAIWFTRWDGTNWDTGDGFNWNTTNTTGTLGFNSVLQLGNAVNAGGFQGHIGAALIYASALSDSNVFGITRQICYDFGFPTNKALAVYALGDSMTAGGAGTVGKGETWPNQLQAMQPDWAVWNAGLASDTASNFIYSAQIGRSLDKWRRPPGQPMKAVAFIGHNDVVNTRAPIAAVAGWNLTIASNFSAQGAAPYVISMTPALTTYTNYPAEGGEFNKRMAGNLGSRFINLGLSASNSALFGSDSRHPSASGHRYIAQKVQQAITGTGAVPGGDGGVALYPKEILVNNWTNNEALQIGRDTANSWWFIRAMTNRSAQAGAILPIAISVNTTNPAILIGADNIVSNRAPVFQPTNVAGFSYSTPGAEFAGGSLAFNKWGTNLGQRSFNYIKLTGTASASDAVDVRVMVDWNADGNWDLEVPWGLPPNAAATTNTLSVQLDPSARWAITNMTTGTASATLIGVTRQAQ